MIAEKWIWQPSILKKFSLKAWAVIIATSLILIASGTAAGQTLYTKYLQKKEISRTIDTDLFYPGIIVQGIDLGGKSMPEAKAAVESAVASAKPTINMQIAFDNQTWEITEKDLRFQYPTEEVLKEAYAYARSGDRTERYRQVLDLQVSPKQYVITGTADETSLKTALNAIADQVDAAPQSPRVTSFNTNTKQFSFADGCNGRSVDREKLLADANAVLQSGGTGNIQLTVKTVPFEGSLADLKSHMKKLGSFSTVSKNSANGTYNMTRALLSANGIRVEPGATFSFFDTAGQCGRAQGYKPAGAILNGKLVQEYGGGICQASTTIYGAAMRSGMKIAERYNHSIPSSYCPIGQDATVSYPTLDFKFTNPTDYPIFLVTSVKNRVLTATFYGYLPDEYDWISVTSKIIETIPAPSKAQYSVDPSLKSGTVRLDAKARTGYRVQTQRTFWKNKSIVKTESLPSSYYRPSPAYYSYGKGTNSSAASSSSKSGTSSKQNVSSASTQSASSTSTSRPSPSSTAPSSSPASSSSTSSGIPSSDTSSAQQSGLTSSAKNDMAHD